MFFFSKEYKSRKENPLKLTQLSSRSHPRHLVGKKNSTQVCKKMVFLSKNPNLKENIFFYLYFLAWGMGWGGVELE